MTHKLINCEATKVLFVDDDLQLQKALGAYLRKSGFEVLIASDGMEALTLAQSHTPDVIILDLYLPMDSGLEIGKRIRATWPTMPIIMVSGIGDEVDRIVGLEMGADDYLTKPFNPRELVARIRTILRRSSNGAENMNPSSTQMHNSSPNQNDKLHFEGWILDQHMGQLLSTSGKETSLTETQFRLLTMFVNSAGKNFTREELASALTNVDETFERSVDVQVMRLRRKIEINSQHPSLIITVRGIGYKFAASVY